MPNMQEDHCFVLQLGSDHITWEIIWSYLQ